MVTTILYLSTQVKLGLSHKEMKKPIQKKQTSESFSKIKWLIICGKLMETLFAMYRSGTLEKKDKRKTPSMMAR